LVFRLHEIVTKKTLDVTDGAGRFRNESEPRVVMDEYGEVLHEPPPVDQLADRMEQMCVFANSEQPFVPPAIRSIILHYWLAYDHPFVDGNGRTARALFYWSMLRRGYWMFEYISISPIIRRAHAKYGRAFLYTQTDDNDLTYFILYHLEVIRKAVEQLHEHIQEQVEQLREAEAHLRGMRSLNHRQQSLVIHALRHPRHDYTIEWQRTTHDVVYDTAHRDLTDLKDRGLLKAKKIGRTWHFQPAVDLAARLQEIDTDE
ncbi:MAG: Fic family protein, partial [Planctomycetota bacterium]